MRRLFVLAALLVMMLGLHALKVDPIGVGDPLTLAAIGFVVLAAFTIAEVGLSLSLPSVTGYILAGVVLGPHAANILSESVVTDMRMFNNLALGLIATTAGLEIDVQQIRRLWRTLAATIGLKVALCFLLVGGTFLAVQTAFEPFAIPVAGGAAAMALVFGALAIGTSPAIVLAVISESRAKGRLSELVLGAAVAKDVVVVVCLAVALAVARSLIAPDASFDVDVLVHVSQEIGTSVLAGAVLGALLIAYIRYVHVEMLIFVAAMILVVADLATALHLELLLVFIVAGFVVRNLSRFEHELMKPLETVALPVFIVFFTIAGAGIDLAATWQVLPVALALAVARGFAFGVAARLGGQIGGENELITNTAVWAYLPQAGVTLALINLARERLPELSEPIQHGAVAVVALHLLIGPVTLRWALRTAGETVEAPAPNATVSAARERVAAEATPRPELAMSRRSHVDRAGQLETACKDLDDPELVALLRNLHDDLMVVALNIADEHWAPWAKATTRSSCSALSGSDDSAALRAWTLQPHSDSVARFGETARRTFDDMRARLRSLPGHIDAPFRTEDLQPGPNDSVAMRGRKLRLRWQRRWLPRRRSAYRQVPVRLAARMALEPELATWSVHVLAGWSRAQAAVFDRMRLHAEGAATAEETRRAIQQELGRFRDLSLEDVEHVLTRGLCELAGILSRAGGPRLPASQVRFSAVEARVRDSLRALKEDPERWREKLVAAQNGLRLVVDIGALRARGLRAVDQHLTEPTEDALGSVRQVVIGVRSGLAQIAADVERDDGTTDALAHIWVDAGRQLFTLRSAKQIEQRVGRYRTSASVHRVAVTLRQAVAGLPTALEVAHPNTPVHHADRPSDVTTWTANLRDIATDVLLRDLLPDIDARVHSTNLLLTHVGPRLQEAVDIASFALESRLEARDHDADENVTLSAALDRAQGRVDKLEAEVGATAEALRQDLHAAYEASLTMLHDHASGRHLTSARLEEDESPASRLRHGVALLLAPAARWWRTERLRLMGTVQTLASSRLSQELKIRYSGERLDAAGLRRHTARWTQCDSLPEAYTSLFALQPVREHRLFTAHREHLSMLLDAERHWMSEGPASALIIGAAGSGRTSLLNVVQLELSVPRVLRPQPMGSWQETGVVGALAIELGCRPQRAAVVNALRKVRTAVLLDDLERWIAPNVDGLRALTSTLDLISQTRDSVFWLVSIGTPALQIFDAALPLRQAFGHEVLLKPLSPRTLMAAIEARHHLSGRSLKYPQTTFGRLMGHVHRGGHAAVFSRLLAVVSQGNLNQAMTTWTRAVTIDATGCVRPSLSRTLSVGLPSLAVLHPVEIALLAQLLRFRAATPRQLTLALGQPMHNIQRHITFLRTAGLVAATDERRDEIAVPRALSGPVAQGLRDLGVWS